MTTEERLERIRNRQNEINQRRAVVQSKIEEIEKHRTRIEQELTSEGIDISDPEKSLDILRQDVLNILDDAETQLDKTEIQLTRVEDQIEEKINFLAS